MPYRVEHRREGRWEGVGAPASRVEFLEFGAAVRAARALADGGALARILDDSGRVAVLVLPTRPERKDK